MSHIISGGKAVRVQNNQITRIREGLTDVSRTIEDLTWTNLSQDIRTLGLDDEWVRRRDLLSRLRIMRKRSPLAKQAFALLKNYTLGMGVTLRPNNKKQVARIIDEFWDDPINRMTFTSYESMIQALDTLFTDGDLFLVLFPDFEMGTVQLGWVDSILVQDIVTDENNWRVPRWYKVRKPQGAYDYKTGAYQSMSGDDFVWYRDWTNPPDAESDEDTTAGKVKQGSLTDKFIPTTQYYADKPPANRIETGLIYHVAINKRGKFGESELAAAADWLKAHKDFMEDRATLSRAAAQIAWKKKRKGPASDVAAQLATLQSSLVQNISRWESNPPSASGSTLIENEGSTMEWMKTDTGAGNASIDERILRMMVGSAVGVMNHYFGDEASANLATATAMELPMLKMYEGWQKLIADLIKDLCRYALEVAHEAGRIGDEDLSRKYEDKEEKPVTLWGPNGPQSITSAKESLIAMGFDRELIEAQSLALVTTKQPKDVDDMEKDDTGEIDWYVDVDFPPIIQREVGGYIAALKNMFSMMPVMNIESQKLVVSMALTALGQNDVDEVMYKLFSGDFAQTAFAVVPLQPAGTTMPGTTNPQGLPVPKGQAGMPGAQEGVPKQPGSAGSPNQPPQPVKPVAAA